LIGRSSIALIPSIVSDSYAVVGESVTDLLKKTGTGNQKGCLANPSEVLREAAKAGKKNNV
jgi:hypothetical protein